MHAFIIQLGRYNSGTIACLLLVSAVKLISWPSYAIFLNLLGFLSGKKKDKKDQKPETAGAAEIVFFLSVLISRGEQKNV